MNSPHTIVASVKSFGIFSPTGKNSAELPPTLPTFPVFWENAESLPAALATTTLEGKSPTVVFHHLEISYIQSDPSTQPVRPKFRSTPTAKPPLKLFHRRLGFLSTDS